MTSSICPSRHSVQPERARIAERIIALAQEHDVPIRQDPNLVSMLGQLQVGQMIPPELYPVVAEVLAFVYRLKDKRQV